MTLRQLYYQLVARDIIPNHDKVYKKIGGLKDDAVYSGLIDWSVFEDRGRKPTVAHYEDGIKESLQGVINHYRLNRQKGQPIHVEVWTEKDAISSILKRVTFDFGIILAVNKGYTSSTAIYSAYMRFAQKIRIGTKVKILYFGDHDPSGLDMIRDIKKRLLYMFKKGDRLDSIDYKIKEWWESSGLDIYDIANYSEEYKDVPLLLNNKISEARKQKLRTLYYEAVKQMYIEYNDFFEVVQVGLTMKQIKQYKPPSNPAKITDPRAVGYVKEFGKVSWEVDALKPKVMEEIVRKAIKKTISMKIFNDVLKEEKNDINKITKMIKSIS